MPDAYVAWAGPTPILRRPRRMTGNNASEPRVNIRSHSVFVFFFSLLIWTYSIDWMECLAAHVLQVKRIKLNNLWRELSLQFIVTINAFNAARWSCRLSIKLISCQMTQGIRGDPCFRSMFGTRFCFDRNFVVTVTCCDNRFQRTRHNGGIGVMKLLFELTFHSHLYFTRHRIANTFMAALIDFGAKK